MNIIDKKLRGAIEDAMVARLTNKDIGDDVINILAKFNITERHIDLLNKFNKYTFIFNTVNGVSIALTGKSTTENVRDVYKFFNDKKEKDTQRKGDIEKILNDIYEYELNNNENK